MKARVTVYLNERTQKPSVNAPNSKYYIPNDLVEIVEIVNGDEYEGNKAWYKLDNGAYVWSGGVEGLQTLMDSSSNHEAFDWWHKELKIQTFWDRLGNKGNNVKIAVLDSGIDKDHIYFNSDKISCCNIWNNKKVAIDDAEHGTQVASVLISNGPKFIGIAPNIDLLAIKIYIENGATIDNLVNGLKKVTEDCDIVCISQTLSCLGNKEDKNKVEDAIKKIKTDLIICATGNDSEREDFEENLPAALENTISVAATKKGGIISPKSSKSKNITLAAPGHNVKCLLPNDSQYFGPFSGTSYSAPLIAGILAIGISYLKSKGKSIPTRSEFNEILAESTIQKKPINLYGKGLIDTEKFSNEILKL